MPGKVNKNVKKIVKKAVAKAERKQHPGAGRKKRSAAAKQRTKRVVAKMPKGIADKLGAISAGVSQERRAAVELAKRFCCPNSFDAFAVQDGFQSQPVGVSSPYMVMPASFSATEGSSNDSLGVAVSELWAFAYRDVHRALQWYDAIPRTYAYNMVDDSGNTVFTYAANQECNPDAWNLASGTDVHGSKLYTGVQVTGRGAGLRLTIGQSNEYIQVTGLPNSTPTTFSVNVLINDELYGGTITATSSGAGVGTFNWSAWTPFIVGTVLPSFFHFGGFRVNQPVTAGSFAKGSTGAAGYGVLRQFSLAGFQFLNQVIEKLRFNALSLMYSNTAAALSRGGYIAAWQVPSNLDNTGLMLSGFDILANKPGAMRIEANEGGHTFFKSTDVEDWEFTDVSDPVGGSSGSGNYVIDADSDYLAICIDQPVAAMRSGYISLFTAVEYRHSSVWFPLVRPVHSRRVFEDALEIQGGIPMLHCNPFHIKDIFNWIGKHKNQIQQTVQMGANALGGARYQGYADTANSFLDIWFK